MNEKVNHQMSYITKLVCEITHLSEQELRSKSRQRYIVDARRLCYCLIRQLFQTPFEKIGKFYEKNHASIIHSIKIHHQLLEFDEIYRERYIKIFRLINHELNNELEELIYNKLTNEEKNILANDHKQN